MFGRAPKGEGRVPGISAVLAFDCRLGGGEGHVWEMYSTILEEWEMGWLDGMGCLRMGCLSEPIRETFRCVSFPLERA